MNLKADFDTFVDCRTVEIANNRENFHEFCKRSDFSENSINAYEISICNSESACYKLGFSDALKILMMNGEVD